MLLGVYSNLPWIIGPYYAFVTMVVGASITRHKIPPGFRSQVGALFDLSVYQSEFWRQLVTLLKPWILAVHGRLDDRRAGHRGHRLPAGAGVCQKPPADS